MKAYTYGDEAQRSLVKRLAAVSLSRSGQNNLGSAAGSRFDRPLAYYSGSVRAPMLARLRVSSRENQMW